MKYFNNIIGYCAAAMAVCAVFGCKQEELYEPDSLLSAQSITFEAEAAEAQSLTIASNGSWMIDVVDDWITVTPVSGTGSTDVSVTVTDNVDEKGVVNGPREGKITIYSDRGSEVSTTVIQKGDNYFGVGEYTVTQVAADLKDEDKAKVNGAHVTGLSSEGYIVTDGTTFLYVKGAVENVKTGDIIYMNGSRATENGLPVFIGDEVSVLSNEEYEYPSPTDITADLDSYNPDEVAYVSVEGTLVGTALRNIPGSPKAGVTVVTPHESLGLSEFNVHKLVLTGYYVGTSADGNINIVVTSVKDNGADGTIGTDFPFNDDFSWLTPFIEAANAMLPADKQISDCVGNVITSADGAANIYTTLADGNVLVLEELRNRGYTDLNPDMKTIYLQDAYLKFGATDKQSGLVLPLMKMDGAQDIQVSFRWCCHLSGALNVDDVKLVVAIDGPGTVVTNSGSADAKISDEITSTQQKGQMFWMDAAVKINGATNATSITIRPNPIGSSDNPVDGVHRYYLDDISVIPASAAVPATISVSGLESANLITFEGTPESTVSFDVTSDMDYTISTSAKWFTVDVAEGGAGETKTVTVTCEPSTLSSLRNGSITIKSGTSTHTINVVQSAAGSDIEPFISVVWGNSIKVTSQGQELSVNVQANVPVSVDEASLPDWIEYKPGVGTRALVEVSTFNFGISDNISKDPRSGQIRFFNEEYNLESVLTVSQSEFTWFEDDFSWMNPYIQYYEEQAGKKLGRSVEDNDPSGNAPNVYTTESLSGMVNKFFELGYVDLNPEPHVLYPQNNYWKFGKTGNNTGIMLPPLDGMDTPSDVILTFNWSCHRRVLNAGKENEKYETDPVNIVVEVVKDVVMGTASEGEPMVTSSTVVYTSEEFVSEQTPYTMEWQSVSIRLDGISKDTRIQIRPSNMSPDSKAVNRWYIDNIKISPAE